MTVDAIPPAPAARPRPGQGVRLLMLLAWPTLLATAVALSPWTQRHWALDLATHMRAHLMVAGLILAPLLLVGGRRHLAALCLLAAAANAWVVQPWPLGRSAAGPAMAVQPTADGANVLRVLFWNVYVGNDDAATVLRLIAQHDADVVVLLEFNAALRSRLEPLRQTHPHYREIVGSGDAFGIALYSRVAGSITRGRLRHAVPYLTLSTASASGSGVQISGVHLYPPIGDAMWRGRDAQLSDLAHQLAGDRTQARIVGGDFNITPWADAYQRFLRTAGLVDVRQGFSYLASWPRRLGPVGIPIDHVAMDRTIRTLDRRAVFASSQSDHAAVLLTVALPQALPAPTAE